MAYLGRPRHKHKPKLLRHSDYTQLNWVEQCEGCGKRRLGRQGFGSESGTYYSRWFDLEEVEKLRECFHETVFFFYRKQLEKLMANKPYIETDGYIHNPRGFFINVKELFADSAKK